MVMLCMPQSHAAEEMALHKIIEAASNDFDVDEDGFITGLLEPLPHSTKDADFNLVSDVAFDDHDVLMLFQNPHVSEASSMHGPAVKTAAWSNMSHNNNLHYACSCHTNCLIHLIVCGGGRALHSTSDYKSTSAAMCCLCVTAVEQLSSPAQQGKQESNACLCKNVKPHLGLADQTTCFC